MSFWFYHYPDRTNYNINIYSLLEEAITNQALPQLEGIKFNHNDVNDYFQSTNLYSDQVAIVPYYSPALVIFGLDKGFGIGTSDYMAPVVNCLKIASNENRIDDAYWYQSFMNNASSVINDGANYYNAVAYRCVYDRYNISMGNPRPPLLPYTQQQCDDINNNLDAIDFFNQLQQIKDDTTCNPTNPL